jgi:hypothetical protein
MEKATLVYTFSPYKNLVKTPAGFYGRVDNALALSFAGRNQLSWNHRPLLPVVLSKGMAN